MNFIQIIYLLLFLSMNSCGKSQSSELPILLSQEGHLLYILNAQNNVIHYDIEKGEVLKIDTLDNVSFPASLFIDRYVYPQRIILFQNGGVNYKIILPTGVKNYSNKSFSHVSDVLSYNNDIIVNTVNGLYICSEDSLKIIERMFCNNNDSTCDINLNIINKNLILSEINNLQGKTTIRKLDSSYKQQVKFILDGVIKSKIYFSDNLKSFFGIKEKNGNLYFVVLNGNTGNEEKHILLNGYQSGSDVFYKNSFIYYDGTSLNNIDIDSQSKKWILPYSDVLEITNSEKYICIQSSNGIKVIDYFGKVIYGEDTSQSVYKPVLFMDYLVKFDGHKGIIRTSLK
ncbi:MAG: hypothetical protein LW852_10105 [Sediminibacterium sp.]|nr:hypothetical protein [Sediminibacterium sp.]